VTVGERFGANFKRCRRRVGLSQEEVGVLADLHRTHISLMERGERVPRIDTLIKVAAVVEADVGELLAGIDWVTKPQGGGSFYVAPWAVPLPGRGPTL